MATENIEWINANGSKTVYAINISDNPEPLPPHNGCYKGITYNQSLAERLYKDDLIFWLVKEVKRLKVAREDDGK